MKKFFFGFLFLFFLSMFFLKLPAPSLAQEECVASESTNEDYRQCGGTCNDTAYDDKVTVHVQVLRFDNNGDGLGDGEVCGYQCEGEGQHPEECGNEIPTCAGTGGCPPGYDCRNGVSSACVRTSSAPPIVPAQKCEYDNLKSQSTCPDGMVCNATQFNREGTCVAGSTVFVCKDNSECPPGDICQASGVFTQKTCVVDPNPPKNKLIDCEKIGGKDTPAEDPKAIAACNSCLKGEDGKGDPNNPQGIWTALGCIQASPTNLIGRLFGIILGLAGGVALILIIYSGYRMMVSAGNPEALQGARETLTSAIVGLLFIIFSFVILEVIGVDILKIPSFGSVLAPQSVREDCQDHAFALNNMSKCGSDWAKVICKDKLDAIEDDRATEKDREIWKLCISKGITRFD